jgi:hypothetical protein
MLLCTKKSGEAVNGDPARRTGYHGWVGVLGRLAHEITARPTLGRIRPGLPDDALGGREIFAPCRPAPRGVGLRAAPAPPRNRYCSGSISRSRLASVVSYAPLLVRTPTPRRDPHPCDGFAPVLGQRQATSSRRGMQEKNETTYLLISHNLTS